MDQQILKLEEIFSQSKNGAVSDSKSQTILAGKVFVPEKKQGLL